MTQYLGLLRGFQWPVLAPPLKPSVSYLTYLAYTVSDFIFTVSWYFCYCQKICKKKKKKDINIPDQCKPLPLQKATLKFYKGFVLQPDLSALYIFMKNNWVLHEDGLALDFFIVQLYRFLKLGEHNAIWNKKQTKKNFIGLLWTFFVINS